MGLGAKSQPDQEVLSNLLTDQWVNNQGFNRFIIFHIFF